MTTWKAPADYGLAWLYASQTGGPEEAARVEAARVAAITQREAALRRMEASDSPLLRDMARALGGASRGPVCRHGIATSVGCGRCEQEKALDDSTHPFWGRATREDDEQMGAAMSARFERHS